MRSRQSIPTNRNLAQCLQWEESAPSMLEEDEASLPCFAHLRDFEHKAARTVQIYNQNGARHAPYQVAAALERLPGSGRPAPSRKHKVTRPGRSTGRSTKEKIASEGGAVGLKPMISQLS